MKLKIITITLLLSLSFSAHSESSISKEKRALIDTLLQQTGQSAVAMGKQFSDLFIQQMVIALKRSRPDINPKAFDIVKEEINGIMNEEFVINGALGSMMYPIYDRHFTADELRKMIELNNTDFGKKMIRVMPRISQEGMHAGQQFGQQIAPKIQQRIIDRLKKEGIE